jgi:hypothetical protein
MSVAIVSKEELTKPEEARLKRLEGVIQRGMKSFLEVGRALTEVRDQRLYRGSFPSFELYLRERWGFNRQYAYMLIGAADVVTNLSTVVDTVPQVEWQARPLTKLTPQKQIEVWKEVVASGEPITRELIDRHIKEHVPPRTVFRKGGAKEWREKLDIEFAASYQRLISKVPERYRLAAEKRIFKWIDKRRDQVTG